MICKKAIKNAVIFTAMLLIVSINSTPLISKAGNSFGVAFSVDGETTFTDTQSKSTSSSVQMLCISTPPRIPRIRLNHTKRFPYAFASSILPSPIVLPR